jgi:hypothetical protein
MAQQLRCCICLLKIALFALIEKKMKRKKGICAYNKTYGTRAMKLHVKVEHKSLLTTSAFEKNRVFYHSGMN